MSVVTTNYMAPGVHTAIEFPDRVHQARRFGWGLFVEQGPDPGERRNNWFHIGVPYILSDRIDAGGSVRRLFVQLELNENARLAEIHLRGGRHLAFRAELNLTDTVVNRTFEMSGASFRDNPFTVCFRIEFLTGSPIGAVTFIGAGLQLVSADDDA